MGKKYKRKWKKRNYLKRKTEKGITEKSKRKTEKETKIIGGSSRKTFIDNPILAFLRDTKFNVKRKISTTYEGNGVIEAHLKIPEKFSFLEEPDKTIEVLQELYCIGMDRKIKRINFNHSECNALCIGASTVMDVILLNLRKDRKKSGLPIDCRGTFSNSTDINEILLVSGLLNHLGITKDIPLTPKIKKLNLIEGGSGFSKTGNSTSGEATTRVVNYFDDCLQTQDFSLSRKGKQRFSHLIGEVIDNCGIHSGAFCKWYTLGHYSLFDDDQQRGVCHMVIFNLGQTIYESLKAPTTTEEMRESLEKMSNLHKGFFGLTGWDEESLWTLYSLQEGVSRLYDRYSAPDRGTGTIRLIDNFQKIGDTDDETMSPIMSIVSGNVCIYFNNKYSLKEGITQAGHKRQIIAFNLENDLTKPPDRDNVFKLNNYFPGTVISMRFYLDKNYIQKKMEEGVNGD